MLVTVGWIAVINTGGETTTDANGKYGPPIMMMIIGAMSVFLSIFFIIDYIFCHSGWKYCTYFFVPITFLVILSLAYLLPYYTLEMIETKEIEDDYIRTVEELAQTHGQTIDAA